MAVNYSLNSSAEVSHFEDYANLHKRTTTPIVDKYSSYYHGLTATIDLILLNGSGYLITALKYNDISGNWMNHINLPNVLLVNFIWFYVTQFTKLYNNIFAKDSIPTIKQSIMSLFLFSISINLMVYLVPEFKTSDRSILYTIAIFAPVFLIGKVAFLLIRRKHRASLIEYTKVVIVGGGSVGIELSKMMSSTNSLGYQVVGFFDNCKDATTTGTFNKLGSIDDCIAYVKQNNIKEIYCTLPDEEIDSINALMRAADKEMIRFKYVPNVKNYFKKNVTVKMLGHFPVISQHTEPLENVSNKIFKRAFDIVFSLLVMVFVMSWLFPILAILIKIGSKGPVLFKQLRSGKDNKPFYCYKFRSMRVNQDSDKVQAHKNDKRVTKLGAFLRKSSLDELPQFFNVLMGQMSVIGPRPHMIEHTTEYSKIIDQFMVRHYLLPGITGWAQVSGYRGETREEGTMEARVEADIWYLENWSMLLDFKIAFLTVWQVIAGSKNAY